MNKEFEVINPTANQLSALTVIENNFDMFLDFLKLHCPESREFSITKTKLEEACFFAKKSIFNKKEEKHD